MSRIVIFHGIEHRAGCTMAAQSAAELIAKEKKELTVLFAALNGRKSAEYIDENVVTVDEFKVRLKSGIGIDGGALTPSKKAENLYIIAGIDREEEARHFLPEMAEALLRTLSGKFDVVIVDSGSEPDNGLALGALKADGIKYLIIEQAESSLKRYEKLKELYGRLEVDFDKYILSKHLESDPLTVNYVASRLGIDRALFMEASYSGKGRIAEMEYRTLQEEGDDRYRADIAKIVNDIMGRMNIEGISLKRRRTWKSFI